MDSLPGAANWKQEADSLLRGGHNAGPSVSQVTPNTSAYWLRQGLLYEARLDYSHALQCMQQARALASGLQKSTIDRFIASLERNMRR